MVSETPTSVSIHPVYKSGQVGSELISATTAPGSTLATRVVLTVGLESKPTTLNVNAYIKVVALMDKVSQSDPSWKVVQ